MRKESPWARPISLTKHTNNASLQVSVGKRLFIDHSTDYSTGKQTSVTYSSTFLVCAGLTW